MNEFLKVRTQDTQLSNPVERKAIKSFFEEVADLSIKMANKEISWFQVSNGNTYFTQSMFYNGITSSSFSGIGYYMTGGVDFHYTEGINKFKVTKFN